MLETRHISAEKLHQLAEGGYVYAVIDACDQPLVPPKMNELGEGNAVSLFKGTQKEAYWAFAPYLVHVDLALLHWIRENLWGTPWGIFVLTNRAALSELAEHFRPLLFPQLPDRRHWLLRYYDPRVLETYLTSCTVEQLRSFYGPARALAVTSAGEQGCISFTAD